MPLTKKAPAIVTLEVKVEEPVKQLLEDYARFIESSPDHVVNSVIKKNLWRDQEYRKWREQHRAQPAESPKGAAAPRGEEMFRRILDSRSFVAALLAMRPAMVLLYRAPFPEHQ